MDSDFVGILRSVAGELRKLEATADGVDDQAIVSSLLETRQQVRVSVEALAQELWSSPGRFWSTADWHSEFSRH